MKIKFGTGFIQSRNCILPQIKNCHVHSVGIFLVFKLQIDITDKSSACSFNFEAGTVFFKSFFLHWNQTCDDYEQLPLHASC